MQLPYGHFDYPSPHCFKSIRKLLVNKHAWQILAFGPEVCKKLERLWLILILTLEPFFSHWHSLTTVTLTFKIKILQHCLLYSLVSASFICLCFDLVMAVGTLWNLKLWMVGWFAQAACMWKKWEIRMMTVTLWMQPFMWVTRFLFNYQVTCVFLFQFSSLYLLNKKSLKSILWSASQYA